MAEDIETALTERAWRDPEFALLLQREPSEALKQIGVELPGHVRVEVKIQDRNTLYYLVPPATDPARESELDVINQMDLWGSGDLFCWVAPERLKYTLLEMRLQYRRWQQQNQAVD